jgi:hypothetical protein
VDGTGSGSCPVAGFGISGVEPWGSATTVSVLLNTRVHCFQKFLHGPALFRSFWLRRLDALQHQRLTPRGSDRGR